jgi:predicted GIY-YIG superfamily endonuclease
MGQKWWVYIIECGDGSLYTGITTDVERRFEEHARGRGARYTRGRGPLKVVHTETSGTKSEALRRELAIKAMSPARKRQLVRS